MKAAVSFICDRLSLAVVAIGTVIMVLAFVVIEVNAVHLGAFPVVLENNSNVIDVFRTSGADLRTGDRIDLASLSPQQRFALLRNAPAGATMTVTVLRDGRSFPLRLTASAPNFSPRARLARDVAIPLCFFLSLALASALFLIRPRPITLAFYIYTMLMLVKVNQTALDLAAWPMNVASDLAIQAVYPLAQLMILIFARRLYGRPSLAGRWFFTAAVALSVVVFIAWVDTIAWVVFQRYGFPGPTTLLMSVSDALLLIVVLAALAHIASGATAIDRTRISWVIAGIALAPLLDLTWAFANILSTLIGNASPALIDIQDWTNALGPWFGLAGSAFVIYGLLSERAVDLRFAIGRAALYAAATACLVVLFGIIEWWTEQIFEDTRPAIYVSLFVALLIGFSLNAVHGRVEDFLNAIFFRDQRRGEEALRHAARALANTSSEKTLIEFLVDEPVRVLGLSSAALFLARGENATFERTASRGWNDRAAESIDAEDPLIVELRADFSSLQLDGRQRTDVALPSSKETPAIVVPLIMRGNVFGFVFYGSRESGAPLAASEQSLLEALARSAAAAYDHIDADRSRARIKALEEHLRTLGAAIPD